MPSIHQPVLLNEILESLLAGRESASGESPVYLDGTLGGSGHAKAVIAALGGRVRVIGLDRDPGAIERARKELAGKAEELILECADYRKFDLVLDRHGIKNVDLMLLDLGISSDELDASGRGFSFLRAEPLLMTMGDPATYAFTARDILNEWKEEDIANVIFAYGEERYARRIAKAIADYRSKKKIETADELAEIVRSGVPGPYRTRKIHPATKTFQALRIAVNDELKALEEGIAKGYERLKDGGRMAVISFHSLEDRIVKDFMRTMEKEGGRLIERRVTKPSEEEIADNPRSRSARLRAIEKHLIQLQ